MLEDGEAEAFDVAGKQTNRAITQKLRKLGWLVGRNAFHTSRVAQTKFGKDDLFAEHRAEKNEPRGGNFLPNSAQEFRPVARTFAQTPHANETNLLFRETDLRRLRALCKSGAILIIQTIRLHDGGPANANVLFQLFQFIFVRQIEQIAAANRFIGVPAQPAGT